MIAYLRSLYNRRFILHHKKNLWELVKYINMCMRLICN